MFMLAGCNQQPSPYEQVAGRWLVAPSSAGQAECAAMDPIDFREKSVDANGTLSKAVYDREGERILVSLEGGKAGPLLAVSVKGSEMTIVSPRQCAFLREAAAKEAVLNALQGTWTIRFDKPGGTNRDERDTYETVISGEGFEDTYKGPSHTVRTTLTLQRLEHGFAVYTFAKGSVDNKPLPQSDEDKANYPIMNGEIRIRPIDGSIAEVWLKADKFDERAKLIRLK
ncbi:hypothetical protein [Azospirillum canadense]|uniref:hypothetical protein n=1 Tax=Azospirillum canadense TaxID=403962 RepID=UPI0022269006|nr:hypothetical protein [Azospirillum canadense]MCW2240726.1 hypothetical protein [Azospirillum canadense]